MFYSVTFAKNSVVSDYGQILKIAVCPQRNLGVPPGIRKNPRHHGTNFNQYSVVRGHDRAASHLVLIMFQLAFPLSQARTP